MDVAARRVPAGSELHRALNRSLAECWTLGAKVARKSGQSSKAYNLLLEAEKYSREELFLERAKLGWESFTQCCFRGIFGTLEVVFHMEIKGIHCTTLFETLI